MKTNNILKYVILGLFTASMLLAGIPKMILMEGVIAFLGPMGFSLIAIQLIGLGWVLSAILVWFEQLRSYGVLLASHMYAGVIAVNVAAGNPFPVVFWIGPLLIIGVFLVDNIFKKLSPNIQLSAEE